MMELLHQFENKLEGKYFDTIKEAFNFGINDFINKE